MSSQSIPLARCLHSASASNSLPAKRRVQSPEEDEVDYSKLSSAPPAPSPRSSPHANDGESTIQVHSTRPSPSHADVGLAKYSKQCFPVATTADSQNLTHPRRAIKTETLSSSLHVLVHHRNVARHTPRKDYYRPLVETDSYRPSYSRSRSRLESRLRLHSASPPPQPPLHSASSATSYERSSGDGYDGGNGGGAIGSTGGRTTEPETIGMGRVPMSRTLISLG
ncbi:hypothetical protein BDV93DRAFT_268700 [Ceratobasidium sp. AG-I]|nr:hypothetical protein BDV93DRAFT_268700 [Ceratobasidium sp. AG-I]